MDAVHHIPAMTNHTSAMAYHVPAMLKETIEGLAVKPGGVSVDVTFGGGGHSRAILERMDANVQRDDVRCTKEGGHSRAILGRMDANVQRDDVRCTKGSRIESGGTDEASNGGNNAAEQNNETSNGGNNAAERDKEENKEGHLYSFDQDIEAYENAVNNPTPGSSTDGHRQSDRAELFTRSREGGMLYSFDQDIEAFNNSQLTIDNSQSEDGDEGFVNNPKWTFVHSNFRYLKNWMDYYGVKEIDGLLADLGVSFHHFDSPERGFSFRFSAPLDMRMNQKAKRTATDIVNSYSEEELARIFWLYGEMKNSRQIARAIIKARARKAIERTEELIENLTPTLSSREGGIHILENGEIEVPAQYKKDLARLFQALRIEVNDEMGALREMLVTARDLLKPGGRIAILTYHSLEDRLVKNFLRSGNLEGTIEKDFYGNIVTPFKVIEKGREASAEEVERNPRSRSAKLRVAERR